MKRLCTFALVLVFLLLPVSGAKAEESFRFTRENFPKLDGSTSMVPLGEGIASVLLGERREDAASVISFNRTTQSFRNLYRGESDIVIAAEPKQEVFQEMAENRFPYLMEQIAKEALVFVVNADNPVNSLTQEQVRGIYAGEITNWSQVGGEDLPIAAFQRNPTAGSQVMMEKLAMEGKPMMEAPSAMVPEEMGELIESVRSYDNSANAIGYTVFYYASDMQMAQGLKILEIDGVMPSAETLRSEAYPYLNGYYACVSAAAPKESPERRLYDWLLSQAGQELLTLEGYVSVYGPGEAPTEGSDIHTDYSAYAPNGGTPAKYTLFDCLHDRLEPRADYGDIFPYRGAQLYGSWDENSSDYQMGSLMGFFNHRGQLITDPLYTEISPVILDEQTGDYFWVVSTGNGNFGWVTRDGSFVSEIKYDSLYMLGEYLFASTDHQNREFQLLDRQMHVVADQDDFTFDGRRFLPSAFLNGKFLCYYEDADWNQVSLLLDRDRNILMEIAGYLSIDDNGIVTAYDQDWNVTLYGPDLTPIELPEVGRNRFVTQLGARFYEVTGDDGRVIQDKSGSLFAWDYDAAFFSGDGGFYITKDGKTDHFDANGRLLYSGIASGWNHLGSGIFSEFAEETLVLHKLPGDKTLSFPNGSYAYSLGDVISVNVCEDEWQCYLVDKELNPLPQISTEVGALYDVVTEEPYLVCYDSYGFSGEQRLLTADAQTQLFRANGELGVQAGYLTVSNDWAFSCYDPQGELIFCYPYYGMGSGD